MPDKLFQPLKVGPREAKNRIIFGSHCTNFARHNLLSEQHADYYAARAAGGAGIIVLEEHIVHPSDMPYEYALAGYLPGTTAAIARVTERIHQHGALAIAQLNHNGQQSVSDHSQREIWAPSAIPNVSTREVPKAMELRDIATVIEGFALVTRHAVQGDADGIELQISDSSLLRQFLSPLTNQRGDQYGGSLDNRLRFAQETIEAVDAALGSNHILGARLCVDELAPWAGLTPEQGIEIARLLTESRRIDYLTITMGSIYSSHMFPFHASMHVPRGYAAHLAAGVKAAINIPVFAAGRIMNTAHAESILAEEQADGVEMIRALIADPQLPLLSQNGQAHDVRPCISCNQGCQVRNVMNAALACTVNPNVVTGTPVGTRLIASEPIAPQPITPDKPGRDHPGRDEFGRDQSRPYIVIGGGPAGMETARVAALRGRRVVLYEREAVLGGTVALAAKAPGRGELQLISDYLQEQLAKLDVEIHTGVEATADMILEQRPQAVIVATGARSGDGLLPITGRDLPFVTDARRILRGDPVTGERVVIIDESGSHGVYSVAELLALQGHSVEIVTEDWYVGHDLTATHDIVTWMQRVMALGVTFTPHTSITRIESRQVIVTDRFAAGERAIPADAVVLGVYEQPAQELYVALKGRVPRLFRAGDCVAPRRIEHAIFEGRQIGEQC
ncbi:MAG TPA: FAD-dependent oxidoreductase [Ktedonobacteraceae bacterium]|nr:FAD-dependent oxidoreductase [Ktedonobacteraceae bacterium]